MNKNKLKNLILYILQRYNNQYLTETKLQKLLYYCDFDCFQQFEKSITNHSYRKNKFGPTLMGLPKILGEMEKEGLIRILKGKNYYGTPQKMFSLETPDVEPKENFTESELLIINKVNEAYKELTPREISSISHADFPYLATDKMGDIIKYEYALLRDEPADDTEEEDKEAIDFFSSVSFSFGVILNPLRTFGLTEGTFYP